MPRLTPLDDTELDDETRRAVDAVPTRNIMLTAARHPALARRWSPFGHHIFAGSSLRSADTELITLRTAHRCGAVYEFSHHARIALDRGLTADDVDRIASGPDAPGWDDAQRLLLRAVDELLDNFTISDATWSALATTYSVEQLMDIVFTCGGYRVASMALRSFGVELEPTIEAHPAVAPMAQS